MRSYEHHSDKYIIFIYCEQRYTTPRIWDWWQNVVTGRDKERGDKLDYYFGLNAIEVKHKENLVHDMNKEKKNIWPSCLYRLKKWINI